MVTRITMTSANEVPQVGWHSVFEYKMHFNENCQVVKYMSIDEQEGRESAVVERINPSD